VTCPSSRGPFARSADVRIIREERRLLRTLKRKVPELYEEVVLEDEPESPAAAAHPKEARTTVSSEATQREGSAYDRTNELTERRPPTAA
jgi:hypothetical protein